MYDLTVDEAHCFYANGVLVHNCHDSLQYVATRLFGVGLLTRDEEPEDDGEDEAWSTMSDRSRNPSTGY